MTRRFRGLPGRGLGSGFNMPPGVYRTPGDEGEGPCAVCCRPVVDCVCDECPRCGAAGDPACYVAPIRGVSPAMQPKKAHGMLLTRAQLIGRHEARRNRLAEQLSEAEAELLMLQGPTPDEALFTDESPFSRRLADNPDPWR